MLLFWTNCCSFFGKFILFHVLLNFKTMDKERKQKKSKLRRWIFGALIVANIVAVAAVDGLWGEYCALGVFLFSACSWFLFHIGYEENVVYEEDEGSVKGGLKLMLKGWFWLAVGLIFIENCTP